jgi:uncharacterized protein YdhG (YjbR/CyaY superfamily)
MSDQPRSSDVDAYIAAAPAAVRPVLEEIREVVRAAVPDAVEVISYRMPAFRLERIFFYYAAFKSHIGIYPPVQGDENLMTELQPFRNEKGNLRFPLNRPIPYVLIDRIASVLAHERGRKAG